MAKSHRDVDDDLYVKGNQRFYGSRIAASDDPIEVMSSGDREKQRIRFDVLTDVGITEGASVLDVGCGYADFFSHLQQRGISTAYTGVDIMPEFIDRAKERHPDLDLRVRNVLEEPFADDSFDYVVASQVANLRIDGLNGDEVARTLIDRMYVMSRQGVACDFVTNYVDFKEPYLHYHDPLALFHHAKQHTKRVVLRHDYPLYEFCIYMYPDFEGWRKY